MLRHEFLFTGTVTGEFVETLVDDVVLPLLLAAGTATPRARRRP